MTETVLISGANRGVGFSLAGQFLQAGFRVFAGTRAPASDLKVLAVYPGWVRTNMGGRQAHVSAEESAAGIFKLALRDWAPDDKIYLDYQGNALAW